MIPKGTTVRVRTTNGGDVVGQLYERYRPTYDAVIEINGHWLSTTKSRAIALFITTGTKKALPPFFSGTESDDVPAGAGDDVYGV
jgi:hypothetical protein